MNAEDDIDALIEQRKRQAAEAGYDNPLCASCAYMSSPQSATCRKCISASGVFTVAVNKFLKAEKGTMQ